MELKGYHRYDILEDHKMRVLLADDQDKVRSALRLVINQEPNFDVIGEVREADQLLIKIEEYKPDLLLLDWELLPSGKRSFFKTLQKQFPHMHVIAMSACILSKHEAIDAGADAFVCKVEPVGKFITTLRNLVDLKNVEV
jgi:DNA-binding NarL/FixJ family response regulator